MPVNLILSAFDNLVTMGVAGSFETASYAAYDVSATAVLYAPLADFRNVFQIAADAVDVNDVAASDIQYYVDMSKWTSGLVINPANAMLDQAESLGSMTAVDKAGVALPANKMLVKHDFIRYISKKLFNTVNGVDLFNNESALVTDIASKGASVAWTDISGSLWSAASAPLTNSTTSTENITRELLLQLASQAPERFQSIAFETGVSTALPFQAGDSITFKFTIAPAANQHLLTMLPNPIPARPYAVKVILGSATNTIVID